MNRPQHAKQTINRAERLLHFVTMEGKQDFLEVGCGSGAVSNHIAKKYSLNVTGTDIDPDQIRLAQQNSGNLPAVRFFEADATHLPFQDNDFDVVHVAPQRFHPACNVPHTGSTKDSLEFLELLLFPAMS